MARPISPLRAYLVLQRAAWKASFAYRGNTANMIIGVAAVQGVQLLFIGVLLDRFGAIAGWSTPEIALLYGMRLTAHGVCTTCFGQHAAVSIMLREGYYDRFLLRPVNPFVQVLTARFNLGTLGDLGLGLTILIVAAQVAPVRWTPVSVLFLTAAMIGGGLVEAGVQIALSGLSFRLPMLSAKASVNTMLTDFGTYPMPVFGRAGAYALTFVLPLAFVAYLPCTVLLGRTGELFVPVWLAYGAPLAGPALLYAGYRFFAYQSRHYVSTGN
ncbi:ABC-2 family transporter protein [Streptosporangium soli]|nr:ABC-2 family transporter protein [Streptosporangium sp. KLBMP 9127]